MHASPYLYSTTCQQWEDGPEEWEPKPLRNQWEKKDRWKEESEEEGVLHRRTSPEAWDKPQVREQLLRPEEGVPLDFGKNLWTS